MRIVLVAASALIVAACGSSSTPAAPVASTSTGASQDQPSTASSAQSADAGQLVAALHEQIPQVKLAVVYTEANDPNNLLGRPGGYTAKAAFVDARVKAEDRGEKGDAVNGGSIEIFADQASAQARSDYISGLQKNSPMLGTEYHTVAGGALLRVSGVLTPTQAKKYAQAWPTIVGQ